MKKLKEGYGRSVVNGRELITPPSKEDNDDTPSFSDAVERMYRAKDSSGDVEEVSEGELEAEATEEEERRYRFAKALN